MTDSRCFIYVKNNRPRYECMCRGAFEVYDSLSEGRRCKELMTGSYMSQQHPRGRIDKAAIRKSALEEILVGTGPSSSDTTLPTLLLARNFARILLVEEYGSPGWVLAVANFK